ncbi:LysR family transcriptional regulator [Petroclostridium xylanilyticum]|uniref:LysR family transcriptional regulator n=1 Tax=Petroclostridium xylanilyticum TaxID=1792311 RepID=UPI000B98EDD1|nr:LysR family transcriptional regulator [Petroclostridium xylanilyticum]
MTLRHLKIFITVADLSSMTKAAESLYIAQPTVSQAVSELESYYDVKLFDRLSRRLYITEAGKQLLGYARHITALFDEMEQAMKNTKKNGILKVGASVTVGSVLLPQLVSEFARTHPSMQIEATIKNTKEIEALIIKNVIDFGVVEGVVHTPDIVSTAFMDDELVLVCGKSHSLYNAKSITPFELSKLKFIVREKGSGTRELFESMLASMDIKWQLLWECNGSEGIKSAVASGIGVTVISKRLVEKEVQNGEMSEVAIDGIRFIRKFSIIYHKNKYLTEAVKDFIKLCYSFAKE